MMAYERIEPFGALHDEFMHGQAIALQANINRDSKSRREPFVASDFMPALERAMKPRADEPLLLEDKEAQSHLIANLLGRGVARKGKSA